MPDGRYIDDPAVSSLSGSEEFPITQGGADKKCTPSTMLGFIATNYTPNLEDVLTNGNATGSKYIELTTETASRVLITDSSKQIVSSAVDTASLTNISGTRANIQTQIDATNWKLSCRVATTVNIALTGLQTIDGVSVTGNQFVLVKDQTVDTQNGIYRVRSSAWQRREDFDNETTLAQAVVRVEEGSVNANTEWVCQNTNPVTIGTDPIMFTQNLGTTYAGVSGEITIDVSNNIGIDPVYEPSLTTDVVGVGISGKLSGYSSLKYDGAALQYKNQYSISSTPSISAGAAAGSSPPVISTSGTNKGGYIVIMAGTGIIPSGTIATITFSSGFSFPNSSVVVLFSKNDDTTTIINNIKAVGSSTGFIISTPSATLLVPGTLYEFNYIVEGY